MSTFGHNDDGYVHVLRVKTDHHAELGVRH